MIAIDNDNNITISRGDTASIIVDFESDSSLDGAVALVTLKRRTGDVNALWVKRYPICESCITVAIGIGDTAYPFGIYQWDIRLILANGAITTPMSPRTFRIAEVVGDV